MVIYMNQSLVLQLGWLIHHLKAVVHIPVIWKCFVVVLDINGIQIVVFFLNFIISFLIFYLGGKCGICGEPYDRQNKLFEKGGAMYLGKIVKTYNQGEQIDVKIKVN